MTHTNTVPLPTKYCVACGAIIDGRAKSCPTCKAVQPAQQVPTGANVPGMFDAPGRPVRYTTTDKRMLPATLLCGLGFFAVAGIHRFYVGKIGTGVLMLLTFGGLGIWSLIDFFRIVSGQFTDKDGNTLTEWT